jgi:hypothetical protein
MIIEPKRKVAMMTGGAIILMAVAVGITYGLILNSIVVPDDGASTVRNIANSQWLFLIGICVWILILLLDVLVAWGLSDFFKSTNKSRSVFTAWLRIVYTGFLGVAITNLIFVLVVLREYESVEAINSSEIQTLVMQHIDAFNYMWSRGLILFGIHLLALGFLALKSELTNNFIASLLLVAGISYLAVHLGFWLLPCYHYQIALLETWLSLPMAAGELGLGVWLLWKGEKRQ